MTAHAMMGDRQRCLDAGMNDYVTKPIKGEDVRDMIDKWSKRSHGEPQAKESQPAGPASSEDERQSTQTVINVQQALSQLDGDRELLMEVVGVFLDTSPALLNDLQSAASTGDRHKLEAAAHSLKGAASNICAESVRRVSQQLEEMGQRGEITNIEPIVAELRGHLDQLQASAGDLGIL